MRYYVRRLIKPLKLVRLPVPPLPRRGRGASRYFGAGAGFSGVVPAGTAGPGVIGFGAGIPAGGLTGRGAGVPLTSDPAPR
jgi:hypothetical protein